MRLVSRGDGGTRTPSPGGAARCVVLLGVAAVLLCFPVLAAAETVTVGADLGGVETTTFGCGASGGCTYAEASPGFTSPISGVIVRWRVLDGYGPLTLRVLDGNTGIGSGAAVTALSSSGVQEFATDLPIVAGDRIGVDLPEGFVSDIGVDEPAGSSADVWTPSLADGVTAAPSQVFPYRLLINADVQPAPGISSLTPDSAPLAGGTPVVISGHDLTGASAVSFGGTPASSYTVDSDSRITAIAPAAAGAGAVSVSVTTVAGTAGSPQQFTYTAPASPSPAPGPSPVPGPSPTPTPSPTCIIPKLTGKTLKASRKKIAAADCKVGTVTRRKGAKARSGKVVGQSKKPGTVVPAGTVVKVTLGKG